MDTVLRSSRSQPPTRQINNGRNLKRRKTEIEQNQDAGILLWNPKQTLSWPPLGPELLTSAVVPQRPALSPSRPSPRPRSRLCSGPGPLSPEISPALPEHRICCHLPAVSPWDPSRRTLEQVSGCSRPSFYSFRLSAPPVTGCFFPLVPDFLAFFCFPFRWRREASSPSAISLSALPVVARPLTCFR